MSVKAPRQKAPSVTSPSDNSPPIRQKPTLTKAAIAQKYVQHLSNQLKLIGTNKINCPQVLQYFNRWIKFMTICLYNKFKYLHECKHKKILNNKKRKAGYINNYVNLKYEVY